MLRFVWGVLLVVILGAAYVLTRPRDSGVEFKPKSSAELEQLMQGAFVAARPAMLQLKSLQVSADDRFYYSRQGTASGFLISPDGFALTAYHAVVGVDKLEVLTTKQELLPAKVIGWDESRDLALIQVLAKRRLEFLKVDTTSEAKINDPIVEIGNSGNDFIQPRYGAIQGYIQNLELLIPTKVMLSNVPIHPGDSGGAVVNFAGEAIGIGIGYAQDAKGRVSYLVPFFGLAPWLEQLKTGAKLNIPGLGLRVSQNNTRGMDVDYIQKNSPADQAGLKLGHQSQLLLLELDGQKLETLRDFHRIVRSKKIGESIQLLLLQNNKEISLNLRIE